jgi:hypothetical protein
MTRTAAVLVVAALLCACSAAPPAAEPAWTPLFNGKDLDMKILVKRMEVRILKADDEPTPPAVPK